MGTPYDNVPAVLVANTGYDRRGGTKNSEATAILLQQPGKPVGFPYDFGFVLSLEQDAYHPAERRIAQFSPVGHFLPIKGIKVMRLSVCDAVVTL